MIKMGGLRYAEQRIEEFYSSLELDVSQFFPVMQNEHKATGSGGLEHKMNVLLLGSYQPGIVKLMEMYDKGEPKPNAKLEEGKELFLSERMLLVQRLLEYMGHTVMLGNRTARDIRNTWNRLCSLIEQSDHIIVLLNNQGGVVGEHGIITTGGYGYKTVNYIKEGEQLSGLLLQGSLLLPQTRVFWYRGDMQLADLVIRVTEAYQAEKFRKI